ncbi:hypothetical protein [Opitutus sp. ER46]|uniref:tetratricopeptide repeat protein n=1 Tax=Opitutus sp. ER46 TaxID=2161864 RepID=UPI001304BF8C|nr:hypothetical protein [Opitutus sp. ER46]
MSATPEQIRDQVKRLLASSQLSHSDALARLLQFVVDETLQGRGDELKEHRLGVAVFGRPAAHYDPAIDPIVRVQMGRLRRRLQAYYDHSVDLVLIEVPKGGYRPVFQMRGTDVPLRRTGSSPASTAANRVAVLPFVNMCSEPDTEYFSDGLTEELIHVLARDARLQVVARTSTFQFKQQARDVREIGRLLDVGKIVEGSIRRSGSRVRITAQLINASDGCHLWSERYDRELQDIFAIHDEITAAIHAALRPWLAVGPDPAPAAVATRGSQVLDAYNEYLRGRCLWNRRTATGLLAALGHFTRAAKIDPRFARAFAGIADCHVLLGLSGATAPAEAMPAAQAAARRALALDADAPEAHASLGAIHAIHPRDATFAAASLLRAVHLDPSYATAHHWLGLLHHAPARRLSEAVDEIERAVELDPLAVPIIADLGLIHCFADHHREAESALQRSLELAPHFHRPHWFLGLSLAVQHRFAEAEHALHEALRLCPDAAFHTRILGTLGFCYGRWGKRREAQGVLRELHDLGQRRYVPRWDIAQVHAGLGDPTNAWRELEAAATGLESYALFTNVWPTLRELAQKPAPCALPRAATATAARTPEPAPQATRG